MGSADKNGKPVLSRRNTFQRMLDLEKKNKVNRMQASLTTVTTAGTTTNNALHNQNGNSHPSKRPPATLQTTGRAMTAPTLSLSIPKAQVSKDGTTIKYVIKDGNVIPEDEAASGDESERSSICHSPGWDNDSERKRKKEKQEAKQQRKMAKKNLETEEKHAQKMKNRLSKAPPTNKRLSKMAFSAERASSSPAVPTLAETNEGSKISPGERSRRGSIDMGFKSWIQATQAIPVLPWNSSRTTPTDTTPTNERPPSRDTGGFIGGLRLRLSEDAAFPDKVRKQLSAEEQEGLLVEQNALPNVSATTSIKASSPENSIRQTIVQSPPTSIYEELVRTPQQWDAIYAQAGRMANASQTLIPVLDDVPIMQRNIKKTRKASANGYFPAESSGSGEGFSKRESSSSSKVRALGPTNAGESSSQGRRSSSTPSNKPLHSRNGSGDRPNTTGSGHLGSYVMTQRRQSQDVAISTFEDEYRVSSATDSEFSPRGRPESFHTVKSRASIEAHPAAEPRDRSNDTHPLFREAYAAPQLFLEKNPEPPSNAPPPVAPSITPSIIPSHDRRTSKGLKGLKDVARAAFSRQSAPNSPVDNDLVNPDIVKALTAPRRPSANRNSTVPIMDGISGRTKAERILGETLTQSPQSTKPPNFSGHLINRPPIPNRSSNRDSSPVAAQIKKPSGQNARVRLSTDSSEEYSTFDDSSNVTTPIPSRPNSQKEQPSEIIKVGFHSRGSSSERTLPRNGKNPVIPDYDGAMNRSQDSWSRTAMPVDMTDDERLKTPTAIHKHPISDLQMAVEITKAEIEAGLQRQPSLSRSVSTPELQDLSFLPALKHQSLRPQNGKQKASSSTPQPRPSSPTTLIKPPAIQTKSEGSSPISPTSSQHLRSARNNLPQNPAMPPPIAKMFVECCSCHYFHDMPSKIYACMAKPVSVVEDKERGVHGVVETSVKCPWCGHGMRTACCGGWAGVLCLRERLH